MQILGLPGPVVDQRAFDAGTHGPAEVDSRRSEAFGRDGCEWRNIITIKKSAGERGDGRSRQSDLAVGKPTRAV